MFYVTDHINCYRKRVVQLHLQLFRANVLTAKKRTHDKVCSRRGSEPLDTADDHKRINFETYCRKNYGSRKRW